MISISIKSLLLGSLLLAAPAYSTEATSGPESQIVIIDHFISAETAKTLIQYYNSQKTDLTCETDNQLLFSEETDPKILAIIKGISSKILKVMKQRYDLKGKVYQVDHCAQFARTTGNFCAYHADNTYFDCPIHGKDQSHLRKVCDGECPGAKFVPNHTGWREYTALLYLNDNFEGGEILFEDGPCNKLYRKIIPIVANRLLITPNGRNFYHEVFPIRSGKRYSLHFWYTSDPEHFDELFITVTTLQHSL